MIPQESKPRSARTDVAVTWSRIDPVSGLDKLICGSQPKTYHSSVVTRLRRSLGAAGRGQLHARRPDLRAARDAAGRETPKKKEEREKAESFKVANGARSWSTGPETRRSSGRTSTATDQVVQTASAKPAAASRPLSRSPIGRRRGLPGDRQRRRRQRDRGLGADDRHRHVVQVASRPPGGSFSAPARSRTVAEPSKPRASTWPPPVAATVLWRVSGFSETFLQTVSRPPGGAFEPAVNVNSGKDNPLFADLAADGQATRSSSGRARTGPTKSSVRRCAAPARHLRDAGGDLAEQPRLLPSRSRWTPRATPGGLGRSDGSQSIVQQAGYDASPASSRRLDPELGKVGDPLQFSASASDAWPIGPPSFDFGDGASAGQPVSHAYSAPGSYTVTVDRHGRSGQDGRERGDALVKARNFFKIGKLKTKQQKGTGTLTITSPNRGRCRFRQGGQEGDRAGGERRAARCRSRPAARAARG